MKYAKFMTIKKEMRENNISNITKLIRIVKKVKIFHFKNSQFVKIKKIYYSKTIYIFSILILFIKQDI